MIKIDVKTLIAGLAEKGIDVPTIQRDKMLHFGLGCLSVAAAVLVAVVWKYSPGFAMALAAAAMGAGYEWQQKFRGEGEISIADAAFTAAPGLLAWGAWEAFAYLVG